MPNREAISNLKAIARKWLILENIGLISKKELVLWADGFIRDNDEFPDWMIDISTNSSLERIEELDLVMSPITESDSRVVAQRMLDILDTREKSIDQVVAASYRMYLCLERGTPSFNLFMSISDEFELVKLDVVSMDNFEVNLKESLNKCINLFH